MVSRAATHSTGDLPGGAPATRSGNAVQQRRQMQVRWLVHLLLLASFAASLATVTLITEGTLHLVMGLAFVALVVVHVAQRRHTVMRLLGNLGRARSWAARRGRLAWSDTLLALLTVNVLVSGIWDLLSGTQVILHPRSVGIPFRNIGWHVLSALVLLASLCVHVARRSGRLRRSVVR
ncbi:MAG TPA: hypothetical protein VHX67_08470 [Acidimicrobiales bacterium]|nr:hypothetical protein [Acidimicrobiales bacterium]